MNYKERIELKVGILFQTADQYLWQRISLEEAKDRVRSEMDSIRPAQLEAVKKELGKRLMEARNEQRKALRLYELFQNYLPLPYHRLEPGHPVRNYCEENSKARSILLIIDEMEEEETAAEEWNALYEMLSGFVLHVQRQEKNLYPPLLASGLHLPVEKARALGREFCKEISENPERLKKGELLEFLYHQRNLRQALMNYLDLEERVIYTKALNSLSGWDFSELRRYDDQEGYSYIDMPDHYVPTEEWRRKPHISEEIREVKPIDAMQNISELFRMYPKIKENFFSLDDGMRGLNGPLGMELLKESTVGMLAKSLSINTDDLVNRINQQLKNG